jgi:hypothetical protein
VVVVEDTKGVVAVVVIGGYRGVNGCGGGHYIDGSGGGGKHYRGGSGGGVGSYRICSGCVLRH